METTVKVKSEDRLEKLGFKAVSNKIKEARAMKRKMAIAYEHYRYLTPAVIHRFNQKLNRSNDQYMWTKVLDFVPIGSYEKIPPASVLDKLEEAQNRQCFDSFEVGYIKKVPDPLLIGRVKGCKDRFFIDQWDDDVRIQDILKDNEG